MTDQPSAKWTIERVELVLFNLEHKRWQIWQEHSPPTHNSDIDPQNRTGALFRRQVIRLLDGVRKILTESVRSAPSGIFVMDERPLNADVNLVFPPESPCNQEFWHLFLDYCDLTCNKYGITAPKVRDFFRKGDFSKPASLSRDDAADLVSTLPIGKDWDLFGCWYRCWARPGTVQFPPPGADKWHQPFYIARISQESKYTYLETLTSTKVEAICCDLDATGSTKTLLDEGDFFGDAYCVRPPEDTIAGQTYLAYAFLYDNIQNALGFKASYIISFPIEVFDRTHFLQIQIVPGASALECSLHDLWMDWKSQQHESFWVPPVKRYLEEGVQRLSLAYFESRWEEALLEELKHNKAEVDQLKGTGSLRLLRRSLASTAHLLVPLKEAHESKALAQVEEAHDLKGAGGGTTRKRYEPYSWNTYYEWRQKQLEHEPLPNTIALPATVGGEAHLGAQWSKDEHAPPRPDGRFVNPLDGLYLLPDYGRRVSVNGPGTQAPNTIVNSRIEQLVDHQYHNMSLRLRQLITYIDSQRQQARQLLSKHFSDAANRRLFNGTLSDELAKKKRIEYSPLIEKTVFELMRLATGEEPGGLGFVSLERSLLQQPISEITSAFFSIGAAKACTHSNRWTAAGTALRPTKQIEALLSDLDAISASLGPVKVRRSDLEDWTSYCCAWIDDVKGYVRQQFRTPARETLTLPLINRYKALRWPTDCPAFQAALDPLRREGVAVTLPAPAIDMYIPFQRVVDLSRLLADAVHHGGSQACLTLWDSGRHDAGFANDGDSKYRLTDIVLKTRVALFSYTLRSTPATPSRILTANILRGISDPFTKDFGRFFIFSNGLAAEATFDAERPARDWDFNSVEEILCRPETVSLPLAGDNNKVAFAFVWRVFEEERKRVEEVART